MTLSTTIHLALAAYFTDAPSLFFMFGALKLPVFFVANLVICRLLHCLPISGSVRNWCILDSEGVKQDELVKEPLAQHQQLPWSFSRLPASTASGGISDAEGRFGQSSPGFELQSGSSVLHQQQQVCTHRHRRRSPK